MKDSLAHLRKKKHPHVAMKNTPEFPITGKGNMRRAFPFIRRKNGFGQRVWNAIPNEHKFVLSYGDGSSLRYRGVGSNVIISPEAYDAMKQMGLV